MSRAFSRSRAQDEEGMPVKFGVETDVGYCGKEFRLLQLGKDCGFCLCKQVV